MKFLADIILALFLLSLTAFAGGEPADEPTKPPQRIDVSGLRDRTPAALASTVANSKLGDSQVSIRNESGINLEILFSGKEESILGKKGMKIFFFHSAQASQVELLVGAPNKHGATYHIDLIPEGSYNIVVKNGPKGIELYEDKQSLKTTQTAKR